MAEVAENGLMNGNLVRFVNAVVDHPRIIKAQGNEPGKIWRINQPAESYLFDNGNPTYEFTDGDPVCVVFVCENFIQQSLSPITTPTTEQMNQYRILAEQYINKYLQRPARREESPYLRALEERIVELMIIEERENLQDTRLPLTTIPKDYLSESDMRCLTALKYNLDFDLKGYSTDELEVVWKDTYQRIIKPAELEVQDIPRFPYWNFWYKIKEFFRKKNYINVCGFRFSKLFKTKPKKKISSFIEHLDSQFQDWNNKEVKEMKKV